MTVTGKIMEAYVAFQECGQLALYRLGFSKKTFVDGELLQPRLPGPYPVYLGISIGLHAFS